MKRRALLLMISAGLFPVLFSSCSGIGGTAGNGTGSYVKSTAGSGGVQWTGGNVASNLPPEVVDTGENGTGPNVKPTAGSDGVQWTGGNYASYIPPEIGGTAGNGTDANVKSTAGSDGVQWTGGNYVSNPSSE